VPLGRGSFQRCDLRGDRSQCPSEVSAWVRFFGSCTWVALGIRRHPRSRRCLGSLASRCAARCRCKGSWRTESVHGTRSPPRGVGRRRRGDWRVSSRATVDVLLTVAARRLGGSLVGVVTSPIAGMGRVRVVWRQKRMRLLAFTSEGVSDRFPGFYEYLQDSPGVCSAPRESHNRCACVVEMQRLAKEIPPLPAVALADSQDCFANRVPSPLGGGDSQSVNQSSLFGVLFS
jgi:hypothetical protein